jgi:hypothetical protein
MTLGFGVLGGIPQWNSRFFGIFSAGVESLDGRASSGHWSRSDGWEPPLLPNPSWPPLPLPNCCSHPSLFLSSPFAATLYPLHDFLLSLYLPPRSKDREEEEHVELKRKRGSRRCSTPSLLAVFLGETLGKDKIHVPLCNYVFLEVVYHGDWRIIGWIRWGLVFYLEISFCRMADSTVSVPTSFLCS